MTDTQETQLTISDIATLKQIVEVASRRGAFNADELTQVGGVYERISAWLDAVTTQAEEPTEGETDA